MPSLTSPHGAPPSSARIAQPAQHALSLRYADWPTRRPFPRDLLATPVITYTYPSFQLLVLDNIVFARNILPALPYPTFLAIPHIVSQPPIPLYPPIRAAGSLRRTTRCCWIICSTAATGTSLPQNLQNPRFPSPYPPATPDLTLGPQTTNTFVSLRNPAGPSRMSVLLASAP